MKARAAVDESADFATLELALDTLADLYIKTGSYNQAQANLSELIMLKEKESARDRNDPILGTTYRQYARVLAALNRPTEAKVYEAKADAILDGKQAHQ
jgi:tetratricopeptide (TPR) repeat protein